MNLFDLFKSGLTTNLDDAVQRGIIAIRDIAGRDNWKGMDITVENLTRTKEVDVNIPAGTVLREQSGKLQQMMMINSTVVHVPPKQRITHPLDDAICTQPRVPAPPPRVRKIDNDMRNELNMSDEEFEKLLKKNVQNGRISEAIAAGKRQNRRYYLDDGGTLTAVKQGMPEAKFNYTYSAIAPSSLSAIDMAEAYLGIGINFFKYAEKSQAVEMLRKAVQIAPADVRPYYDSVYRFVHIFRDREETGYALGESCGTTEERKKLEQTINQSLKNFHTFVLSSAKAGVKEHEQHEYKAQGRAAERAAMTAIVIVYDERVTDLNEAIRRNFPIYDVVTERRVASVKCHLSESYVKDYINDLETAVGLATDRSPFDSAARELNEHAKADRTSYPMELAGSLETTQRYLRDHSELWIPEDHTDAVKDELRHRLLDNSDQPGLRTAAARLGLNPDSRNYKTDVEAMLERIHGIGINSGDIKTILPKARFLEADQIIANMHKQIELQRTQK